MAQAEYGSWRSPLTAELTVRSSVRLQDVAVDGDDIYWAELRPEEAGRTVVVRLGADGRKADITPPGFNVRTRVNEYGGGAFAVRGGVVYFSNYADGRIYRQDPGQPPVGIGRQDNASYADGAIDSTGNRTIWVREDGESTTLWAAGWQDEPLAIACGYDFYSSPRLTRDDSQLAFICWRHPDMPWDASELWRLEVRGGLAAGSPVRVGGHDGASIVQPEWGPGNMLYFVSDRSGYWNLYRQEGEDTRLLYACEGEFARPPWVFNWSSYGLDAHGNVYAACAVKGLWRLMRIDADGRSADTFDLPYTDISYVRVTAGGDVVFRAGSAYQVSSIVRFRPQTGKTTVLRESVPSPVDQAYFSIPEAIEFPSTDGQTSYAFYYPPTNPDYAAPAGSLPPLLVKSHGGPTSAADSTLRLEIQFWTTRGFAVVDVNYGGSTGFGRAYRQRLDGQWGIVDVADCTNAALYLAETGRADRERLAITGGSAGGFTTLCALTFGRTFRAGASYYGISDLVALTADTHKFESRYLDRLVGPYPQCERIYRERSPLRHADRLNCPVIFFQGLDDRVVPRWQTESMVEAMKERGLPVAYVPFASEQHGFRKAENIRHALACEYYFYSRVFAFAPPDPEPDLTILNMPER